MEYIPGGMISGADSGVTDRASTPDMDIATEASRDTGAEAIEAVTKVKAETGVCVGVKSNIPTLPIPKTESVRTAETRHIMIEVGWDDSREGAY